METDAIKDLPYENQGNFFIFRGRNTTRNYWGWITSYGIFGGDKNKPINFVKI